MATCPWPSWGVLSGKKEKKSAADTQSPTALSINLVHNTINLF